MTAIAHRQRGVRRVGAAHGDAGAYGEAVALEDSEALATELMGTIAGIRRLARRQDARRLPSPVLRPAQVDLLLVVEGEPGIGVAAAARTLHLAANSVSALVNVLVSAGLLRRQTDPTDRRAARLYLTPLATRRLACWREQRAQVVGAALHRLAVADRAAIGRALPALARLLAELRQPRQAS